jgi:hypothetical protein
LEDKWTIAVNVTVVDGVKQLFIIANPRFCPSEIEQLPKDAHTPGHSLTFASAPIKIKLRIENRFDRNGQRDSNVPVVHENGASGF